MNLNLLEKIGLHCAVWMLAFCSAAIAIYGGIVSDLVRIGVGQTTLLCVVSAVLLVAAGLRDRRLG